MVYEELDLILGDHAPFLISLSDGLSEELQLVIATAGVEETGEKIPTFEDTDESTRHFSKDETNRDQ